MKKETRNLLIVFSIVLIIYCGLNFYLYKLNKEREEFYNTKFKYMLYKKLNEAESKKK